MKCSHPQRRPGVLALALAVLSAALCSTHVVGAAAFVDVPSPSLFPLQKAGVADLNHDGLPDALTVPAEPFFRTGFGAVWAFPVHLGTGDGRFVATNSVTTGLLPEDLVPLTPVAGDFNGDGWADIALVFYDTCAGHVLDPDPNCLTPSQTFLAVLLGRADGSLTWTPNRPIGTFGGVPGGYFIHDWAGADVNHDGYTDLVFPASVMLSRGDGGFGEMLPLPAESWLGDTQKLRVADVTGDGHQDVIKAVRRFDDSAGFGRSVGELQIYPGRGDGTFSTSLRVPLPAVNTADLSVADMNRDGVADMVCLDYPDGGVGEIRVVLGRSFASGGQALAAGVGGSSLELADLNDDGAPEAVVQAWVVGGSETWRSVFANDGKGVLSGPDLELVGVAVGAAGAGALSAGDFNVDGRRDLLVVSEEAPFLAAALNRPADVTLTLDGEKTLAAGSVASLSVTVRNHGGGATVPAGVRVVVNLPSNLKFVAGGGAGWTWTEFEGQVRGLGPRLGAGGQTTASIQVQVGIERVEGIRVVGSVSVPGEANQANNSAIFDAGFWGYDLAVDVEAQPGSWVVGTPATVEVRARNFGELPLDPAGGGVFVSSVLPAGLVFLGGPSCELVGSTVTCRLEEALAPGAEIRIPLRVRPGFGSYPTSALAVEGSWGLDGNPGNNRASSSVAVVLEAEAAFAELQRVFDDVAGRVLGTEAMAEHLARARASFAGGWMDAAVRDLGKFRNAIAGSGAGGKDAAALDRGGRLTAESLRLPSIRIEAVSPGRLRVWWTGPSGMALQTSAKVGGGADWVELETEPGRSAAELPASGSRAFFRLESR